MTRALSGSLRAVAGCVALVLVCAAALGWLYALRHAGVLGAGPRLADALALQRLAGGAAQPLLRVVAAWVPAGLVAGVLLAALGLGSRALRALAGFAGCAAVLIAAGAAADAVTANERVTAHLVAQPHRAATWLAAGLAGLGAVAAPGVRGRAR